MMDDGAYDEDYAMEDDDEVCSLLQDSRRRTPIHINEYLNQMENIQKQRKQRRRQYRFLAIAFGIVTICGMLYTQQTHVDLVSSVFPQQISHLAMDKASSFCETHQCIDIVPRSKIGPSSAVCETLDPKLFNVLASYLIEKEYIGMWPFDPKFACTTPRLINYTAVAQRNALFGFCRHHINVVKIEAVGQFSTDGDLQLAKGTFTTIDTTVRLDPLAPPLIVNVAEKWSSLMLQGIPGIIGSSHQDTGIWLTLEFPIDTPSTELELVVQRNDYILLHTNVSFPLDTGLVAVRLNRDNTQPWAAGSYSVTISSRWKTSFEVVGDYLATPFESQVALVSHTYPQNVSTACSNVANNLTAYCKCQLKSVMSSITPRPGSAVSRRPTPLVTGKNVKPSGIPSPTKTSAIPRRSPVKKSIQSTAIKSPTPSHLTKTTPGNTLPPPRVATPSKAQQSSIPPPTPIPRTVNTGSNVPPTLKAKKVTPNYTKATKLSKEQCIENNKKEIKPPIAPSAVKKTTSTTKVTSPKSPRMIDTTVLDLRASLDEHISQQTGELQHKLFEVESQKSELERRLNESMAANQELENNAQQKDHALADYAKACTRYKSDCESFAAKALEWKAKYNQLVASHQANERKEIAMKSRELDKRIGQLAQEVAQTSSSRQVDVPQMDYSLYALPEGDEEEANFERCEGLLLSLQKQLKQINEKVNRIDVDAETMLKAELTTAKRTIELQDAEMNDLKAKLIQQAQRHCQETADAVEKVKLLSTTVEAMQVQADELNRVKMSYEESDQQLQQSQATLAKVQFDKQLLSERYCALQTAQQENQERIDSHDETIAVLREKNKRLREELEVARKASQKMNENDHLEDLDLSVAHASLQGECSRQQENLDQQRDCIKLQQVVINALRTDVDQLLVKICMLQQKNGNQRQKLNDIKLRDNNQRRNSVPKAQHEGMTSPQFGLYEAAIQAYIHEIADLHAINANLREEISKTGEKLDSFSKEIDDSLSLENAGLKEEVEAQGLLVSELEAQLAELQSTNQKLHRDISAEVCDRELQENRATEFESKLDLERNLTTELKIELETALRFTHEMAVQVKQLPLCEAKLQNALAQLQEHEATSEVKQKELENIVETMERTINLLQSEAEKSFDEINDLLEAKQQLEATVTHYKHEMTALREVVEQLQSGNTRLQTIFEQDKEELIDGYVEEVSHLQKRILQQVKQADEDAATIRLLLEEKESLMEISRGTSDKLNILEKSFKDAQEIAKSSTHEVSSLRTAHGELETQLVTVGRTLQLKSNLAATLEKQVEMLETAMAQLQAEKTQYKSEVHAIEAILHETSPLHMTAQVLQQDAKEISPRGKKSPSSSPKKSPKSNSKQPPSPHAALKQLRQRVKELEGERDLLQAELEQATLVSSKRDSSQREINLYVAQVEGLEEKLSEQTVMYLASVKQAQSEFKELEEQYQAKIRHLEMELQLDEARIEGLESRLAEVLSSRPLAPTASPRRNR